MKRPVLAPLMPVYAAALAVRNYRLAHGGERVRQLRWPVVSVGNLSTGGAGKTPFVMALAQLMAQNGWHVDVLSRGYGRSNRRALLVNPAGTAAEFGDEPLLIARSTGLNVYVASQRYQAGLMAEAQSEQAAGNHRSVHLLDDGFQHRQLFRTVDILLLNRQDLVDHLLPAGNLREPLLALHRATVLAIPEDEPEVEHYLREIISVGHGVEQPRWTGPIWRLRRSMHIPAEMEDVPVAAFCGIAHPEPFFAGLGAAGVKVVACLPFADHHRYTARDLDRLLALARKNSASALITTEKDWVRMGPEVARLRSAMPLHTAVLRTEIDDESSALAWLEWRLN